MILSELIDYLKYGELAQLAIINDIDTIGSNNRNKVINNINLGLTELYKVFPLKLKEVIIQQYPFIATYILDEKYSRTNGTEDVKYIIDTVFDPFINDVLLIDQVFTEETEEIPLNDINKIYSIFTPTYNSLQIPYSEEYNAISVIYRAKHVKIEYTDTDVEINIPDHFIEPLLFYIAHRIYSNINSDKPDSNNYYSKYINAIKQIEILGIYNKENYTNLKLRTKGFI